jgi:hypothetical protein
VTEIERRIIDLTPAYSSKSEHHPLDKHPDLQNSTTTPFIIKTAT